MKKYKVVVVGMGKRGQHHADEFANNENFEVVGICDINKSALEALAPKYGNCETGTDAAILCNQVKPDVFCFCTWPNLRLDMIKIAVEANVKMIAMEKPIATSMTESEEIMKLVSDAKIKLVVSHQHRYGEHYNEVKEIIQTGQIGQVRMIHARAMGWMLHMMTHLIEYMNWYNGNANALWVTGSAAGRHKIDDNHPSPDYINGFIQYENGVRGVIECGGSAPAIPETFRPFWGENGILVSGTHGQVEVITEGGWRATLANGGYCAGSNAMDYQVDMPPYIQEMADWLNNPKKVHPCGGEVAFKGVEIMFGICRAVVNGGQVKLPLGAGPNELEALKKYLPETPIFATTKENAKEYAGA